MEWLTSFATTVTGFFTSFGFTEIFKIVGAIVVVFGTWYANKVITSYRQKYYDWLEKEKTREAHERAQADKEKLSDDVSKAPRDEIP